MIIEEQRVTDVRWSIPSSYVLSRIEDIGRICYQSHDNEKHPERFVKRIISKQHNTLLEFADVTITFITNRAIANELVRHRLCSFIQESTRYCLYSKDKFDNQITVIRPVGLEKDTVNHKRWEGAMWYAEQYYKELVTGEGLSVTDPVSIEIARDILPLALKTEIIMKCNIRELRHIIKLRTDTAAHPMIRELFNKVLKEGMAYCPILFEDLVEQKEKE